MLRITPANCVCEVALIKHGNPTATCQLIIQPLNVNHIWQTGSLGTVHVWVAYAFCMHNCAIYTVCGINVCPWLFEILYLFAGFFLIFIYMSFLQPRVTYSFVLRFLSFPYFCLKLYSRRNKNLSDVKNTEGHSVMNAESSRYPTNQTTKCRGTDAEFISEIRSHVMMTPLPWIWKVSVQYFASL